MMLKTINLPKKIVALGLFFVIFGAVLSAQATAQRPATKKKTTASASIKRTFYGQASFYANNFNGKRTSSGEIFSQAKMTCACNGLPMGTWVKVTNLRNDKWVIVKVNDRLHPSMKRVVDLSSAAAKKLGYTKAGLTRVRVEVLGKKKPV